jgi:mono/diheme cytochrome c family protein
MNNGFTARLLIALSLTTMLPAAMAKQDPLPKEPNRERVLREQTDTQPESESKPAMPVTGSRGQLLYENHCQGCHTSVVHVRESRRARSLKDLEYWVTRWSGELKLQWRADEISDVVDYLNRHYYKFEAPSKE